MASIPDLIASTHAPVGFRWQWLMGGNIAVAVEGAIAKFEGTATIALFRGQYHALVHPMSAATMIWIVGPVRALDIEASGQAGIVNKRPRSLIMQLDSSLHIGTIMVNEVMLLGNRSQNNQEVAFLEAVRAAR
ncbi:MAG: hypothetical protein ACTHN0_19480 [Aquihabitans sp.]